MSEINSEIQFCYRHPDKETRLGCSRCGRPICTKCAQKSHVGYRCPDCHYELQSRHYKAGVYVNPLVVPQTRPVLTYALLMVLLLMWLIQEYLGGSTTDEVLIRLGATYGPLIIENGEWWRFGTAMFLHIGVIHLVFNSMALLRLGHRLESNYGYERFIFIYLISGLLGGAWSFWLRGWMEYSAGASGAVFGILGAELGYLFFHRRSLGEMGQAQRTALIQTILFNLLIGASVAYINNAAHLGGLVSGAVLGYLLAPRYVPVLTAEGNSYQDLASLRHRWWVVVLALLVVVGSVWGGVYLWQNYPYEMEDWTNFSSFSSEEEFVEIEDEELWQALTEAGVVSEPIILDPLTHCMVYAGEEEESIMCYGHIELSAEPYTYTLDLKQFGNRFEAALDISTDGEVTAAITDINGQTTSVRAVPATDGYALGYVGVISHQPAIVFTPSGRASYSYYSLTLTPVSD